MALVKSRVLFLPRDAFVRLIAEHPSLSMNMLGELSMRLREFTVPDRKPLLEGGFPHAWLPT